MRIINLFSGPLFTPMWNGDPDYDAIRVSLGVESVQWCYVGALSTAFLGAVAEFVMDVLECIDSSLLESKRIF